MHGGDDIINLKSKSGSLSPFRWLRIAVPVAVLVLLLYWIILVFMNPYVWLFRDTANLPVAPNGNVGHVDGGQHVQIDIDESGLLTFGRQRIEPRGFAAALERARTEGGCDASARITLRAGGKVRWANVEPVVTVLRRAGFERVSLQTRRVEGWPSSVEAVITSAPSNTVATITRDGGHLTLNGNTLTMAELTRQTMEILMQDKRRRVRFSSGPMSTVQEVVDILDMCRGFGAVVCIEEAF